MLTISIGLFLQDILYFVFHNRYGSHIIYINDTTVPLRPLASNAIRLTEHYDVFR